MDVVPAEELWEPLSRALSGGSCVAPVADLADAGWLRPEYPVTEPEAAVIVGTSGSTGRPKAVVLSRTALLASAHATHQRLGGPGVWHSALPTHYVAGLMTLVRAHVAGTRPRRVAPDLSDARAGSGRHYLSMVPTQLYRALGDPELTDPQLGDPELVERLAGFDALLVGGAALDPALRSRAEAAGLRVVATYGMSETCGGCVYDGRPLDGVTVTLDEGRIAIAGAVLFAGYRLDPEATAAALAGGRLLTFDRGALAPDGRLRVLGRLDEVVISGGINVDLAQAQRAADLLFGPAEAGGIVLLGVPDPDWGTRIVAVTTGDWTTAEVREGLRPRLAAAALPQEARWVASLPRTGSGKIDRPGIAAAWR